MAMTVIILGLAIEGVVRWFIYTALLWIMIKIQKLNYNFFGLMAVSAGAIAVSYIPWVGAYLAYPVLVFGLWKVTGADIVPDVVFTVAITRALMFCVNLFLLGALMGDLRPDLNASARTEQEEEHEVAEEEEPEEAVQTKVTAKQFTIGDAHANPKAKHLALKGVSINPSQALAMLSDGKSFHTLGTGEVFQARSPQGSDTVRVEEIHRSHVILTINDQDRVRLSIK